MGVLNLFSQLSLNLTKKDESLLSPRALGRAMRKSRRAKPRLERIFRKMGLAVYRYREDYHYCPRIFGAGYWKKIDVREMADFGELATAVINQKRTFLSYDRLYVLYQAIWNVRHLSAHGVSMAEVGVYRGGGTYFMASVAENIFEKNVAVHAFDTFEGHPDEIYSAVEVDNWPGKFGDTSFGAVQSYLAGFTNVKLHKGRFQDRCVEVSGEEFCFVHLDVDILSGTRDGLEFFSDRLPVGGIIVVDDYGVTTCKGVKQAADTFIEDRTDFIKFHLDTGQCVLIKIS